VTPRPPASVLREWTQRVWGALSGRRADDDLQRELAAHLAMAEEALQGRGYAPDDAARLARAAAGGRLQAIEALRAQRGLPWLDASWLDVTLGLRLLVRNRGLTIVGGLATAVAIGIAAVVFAAFDVVLWSRLPLDEGDRVVALQVWDRQAGRRRDTTVEDVARWRDRLQSVVDVGVFQTTQRNVITSDGAVDLAMIAEISPAGFRVARVPALIGRPILEDDTAPNAVPVVVIGHDVWQRRFGGARDVIGRELRLGAEVHTVVGVMPAGFQFPLNFRYWVPFRPGPGTSVHNTGLEGAVFGRLAPGASLTRAQAEITALGLLPATTAPVEPSTDFPHHPDATSPRVVPYTFAFTGDFEPGQIGLFWSLVTVGLVLLLLPPCANIAILNYARIITRQQEFAARHALGGSRARIVWQLFIEALVLTAAAGGVAVLGLRVALVVAAERLQNVPGGPPFWMSFEVSARTLLFVAVLAGVAAVISGLIPALQATRQLTRLGASALTTRTGVRLGATWTALVVAQVGFSVGVLPVAAQLAWGTLRTGFVGPGFAAEEFATARIALDATRPLFSERQRELVRQLRSEPGIRDVAVALRPPGEEPWVFVDIEGHDVPPDAIDVLGSRPPGFQARFNQVDTGFFDLYQVPALAGRRLAESDASPQVDAVVVNRNFAETIAPGGHALGRRFRYVHWADSDRPHDADANRWYEVVGVVGNLPVTTDARVAYHATLPGQIHPAQLQLRLRGEAEGLTARLRDVAARVDPALQVESVRTLAEIYRAHRFGDNLGALTIGAVTGSVLLLSAAGLYALMSFTVTQRRREIGIRSALGARPAALVAAIFGRACGQMAAGASLGVLGAWAVQRYIPIEQIGGLPIPGILPGAAACMLCVGVLASWAPARRGLRIDPVEALRGD